MGALVLFKREYIYVSLIIIMVISIAVFMGGRSSTIDIEYPQERLVLESEDFVIDTDKGQFTVGQTDWDEAMAIFPDGKKLGGSTVYHPDGLPVYLTFSEDENILIAVHIFGSGFATSRGITVGNSPEKAVQQYGKNYVRFSERNSSNKDYDMLYGENDGNTVIFQIRNDSIAKIIVQHTL